MVTLHKDLFDILLGYSALIIPRHMHFPFQLSFNDVHDFLVKTVLLGHDLPHLKAYPPSNEYQYTFWKWAIHGLEDMLADEACIIYNRIYEHFISLLPQGSEPGGLSTPGPPAQSYVTQYWATDKSIDDKQAIVNTAKFRSATLLESRTTVEGGTTGLRTWLASQLLAQYLILHPELITNKRILELGSGSGFLGIIVASLQQLDHTYDEGTHASGPIWLTDVNDVVLSRCRDNVQLPCNSSSSHPSLNYCSLDWSDALNSAESPLRSILHEEIKPDLILGADLVFDPCLIPALVGTLHISLQHGADAFIALTVRNEDTVSQFLHAAEQSLSVLDLDVHFDKRIFLGVSEGQLDNEIDVKVFKMRIKQQRVGTCA
ncbi:hypothetical protein PILCRDRAFT_2883 [Piloderma croceum F 1598]|uniref:FAM86 N-terminal domain-containing protein n=1 Tax=Piloderma croceum (strain F 1598) TaxID=765440 RepID=A0A0C3BQC3_PILCF|nr:hypothetical protein PILCRDRAFT_2883 [Piloderma croceum F 1598]